MSKEAADVVLKAVQRRAMEIAALPEGEREARYSYIHDAYRQSALKLGTAEVSAAELADKMVEFTRAMVGIIETGGGASGGRA